MRESMKVIGFGLLVIAGAAQAQDRGPIVTDRPDFTESSFVVPGKMLQIESGFTRTTGNGQTEFALPELLLRKGISDRFEIRFGLPNHISRSAGGGSGFAGTYIGFKYQIGPVGNWDLAIIPAFQVPTGKAGFSNEALDPEIKICWSTSLCERLGVSGMFYYSQPEESGARNKTLQTTISFGYEMNDKVGAFFELGYTSPQTGGKENLWHSGFVYGIDEDHQFDLHFGQMSSTGRPWFIGMGYSVRF